MEEIKVSIPQELLERIEPLLGETGETLEEFVARVVSLKLAGGETIGPR